MCHKWKHLITNKIIDNNMENLCDVTGLIFRQERGSFAKEGDLCTLLEEKCVVNCLDIVVLDTATNKRQLLLSIHMEENIPALCP